MEAVGRYVTSDWGVSSYVLFAKCLSFTCNDPSDYNSSMNNFCKHAWVFLMNFPQHIVTSQFPGWPSSPWAAVLQGDWRFEVPFSTLLIWLLCAPVQMQLSVGLAIGALDGMAVNALQSFPAEQRLQVFFYFCKTVSYGNACIRQSIVRRYWDVGTQDGQTGEATLCRSCTDMRWDYTVCGSSAGEVLGCAVAYAKSWLLRVLFL